MDNEVIEIIRKVLYLKEEHVKENTKIDDIVQTSMDVVELIAALSNKYNISIKSHEMNEINTVGDLIAYIKRNRNTRETKGKLESF